MRGEGPGQTEFVGGGLGGRRLQGRGRRSRRTKVLVVLVGIAVLWVRWRVWVARS